jgi:hypothetical protein
MRRWPFLLIVAFSLGGLCGPGGFSPPPPDSCDHPVVYTADSVAIGTGDDSTFTVLNDGDVAIPVTGGQGLSMLPIRMHFAGAVPDCVQADLTLEDNFQLIAHQSLATAKTYAQPDGTFLTKPNYIVISGGVLPGDTLRVTLTSGNVTTSVRVFYGSVGRDLGVFD